MHIPRTCALQCRIKNMLVLSVAVVLMLCVCSKAQAKMSYPYIGVASMQLFDTGNEYWDSQFGLRGNFLETFLYTFRRLL